MSGSSEVICRPTKWFIWRALLMVAMFGGFAGYFLYDWKIGYPKKNYIIANYKAFSDAGQAWNENEESWKEYAASQTIPFEDDKTLYPADTNYDEKWPAILQTMERGNDEELWKDFSGEKGWPQAIDLEEGFKSAYKIREQLYASLVCFVLTAIALFFLIRTKARNMKVDNEAYHPPGGPRIPFADMVRIDKRKWESKGLATIYYQDGDEEKKAKVDGMVYGQFKEEDGAPAEVLFQRILANFEGELIELVEEDDEDEDDHSSEEDESASDPEENE